MEYLQKTAIIRGAIISFIMFITRFAIFVTVLSQILRGVHPTSENLFLVISFYQILRQTMTVLFPLAITQVAENNVSIVRIKHFLLMPESNAANSNFLNHKNVLNQDRKDPKILIRNASARIEDKMCLQNISLTIEQTELIAVIGQVGSGKSALLHLILGEVLSCLGSVQVDGIISYAAQEPWLFAGSVQQNILFGKAFEANRYQKVVEVCGLVSIF